ncbi:hypothetical protein [Streptomyces halobius]|uniref:Uncharacterized protein n=1 Tax=Streptomyces halobius TaxID=2879846 RepID=A0ABY4MLH0_9ACTN|nr:hypothetical protein [Streptomyces halobius]UQA97544.1 hypothetical protein K9S39_41895 [Streptomyces halobius]
MRARTNTTADAAPQGRDLQQPGYGVPSSALLARSDRGLARFLAATSDDQHDADRHTERRPHSPHPTPARPR